MNFNYVTEWKYDANTKAMLKDLKEDVDKTNIQTPINMAIFWFFDPTINFYRESQNLKWLNPVNRNGFDTPADFYYIFASDSDYLSKNNKIIVKRYPLSGNILAKTPK
jgi:mRNA-degrading endonuclease HigB of HigAB toxin-antitoxin module